MPTTANPAAANPLRPALVVLAILLPIQLAGVLVIAHFTRTVYSVDFTQYYGPAAESILQGHGPRLPDGQLVTHYPPAYSFYIAGLLAVSRALGLDLLVLVVAGNLAWNALTALAIFMLAWRMGGRKLAVASALLAGLYPPVFYLSRIAFVQVLDTAFLAWAVYAAYRGHQCGRLRCFVVAGVLVAVAGLLRPAALAMLIMLALYLLIFFRGGLWRRLARPAALLVAFLLIIAPWSAYVYGQQGRLVLLGDVAEAHITGEATATCAADDPRNIRGLKHFSELARHPVDHGLEILRRAGKAWYHTDSGLYELPALALNLPFALLLAAGLWPAWRSQYRWGAGLTLAMFLAAWGLSTLTMYLARYVATGVILAAPIMATGLLWATRKLTKGMRNNNLNKRTCDTEAQRRREEQENVE